LVHPYAKVVRAEALSRVVDFFPQFFGYISFSRSLPNKICRIVIVMFHLGSLQKSRVMKRGLGLVIGKEAFGNYHLMTLLLLVLSSIPSISGD